MKILQTTIFLLSFLFYSNQTTAADKDTLANKVKSEPFSLFQETLPQQDRIVSAG
jgi:hypothetical protein